MKLFLLAALLLLFSGGPSLRADIPAAFDPRSKGPHKGSAFLVDSSPRKGGVLILTSPFDRNPEETFFQYHAILSPKLKNDPSVVFGRFVMIEAKRIPKDKKTGATFMITSVTQIMNW